MKKNQAGYTSPLVIYILLVIAGIVGWVMNIIDLASASYDPLTGIVVLKIIGVFIAPLGAVLGYLT